MDLSHPSDCKALHIQDAIEVVLTRTPREKELFHSIYKAGNAMTFRCVPEKDRSMLADISLLGFAALILLDDTIDVYDRPDIIEAILRNMRNEKSQQEEPSDKFARNMLDGFEPIWKTYISRLEGGINYSIFKKAIRKAWTEILQSLLYASAVNRGEVPSDTFPPFTFHNALEFFSRLMHHKTKHLEDYCFSPGLEEEEVERGLVIATKAEIATRLANWAQWEHELTQYETGRALRRDITNGVIALSIDHKVISYEEVVSPKTSSNQIIGCVKSVRFRAPELKEVCRGFRDKDRTAEEHIIVLMKAVVSEVIDLSKYPQNNFIGDNYGKILARVTAAEARTADP